MSTWEIHCGDCLRILRRMPAGSVDLVFTSPPYEDARTYGIGFKLRGEEWVRWSADRFMECLRVSRGLVAWVVEGKTRNYAWSGAPAMLMVELLRRGAFLRKPPIYHRVGIPGSGAKDWLRNDYEFVVCATLKRGRLPWSDNKAMGHPPKWGPGGEMSNRLSDGSRRNQWGAGPKSSATRRTSGKRQAPGRPSHVVCTPAMMRVTRGTGPTGEQLPNRAVAFPVLANPGNVIKCLVGGNLMGSRLAHENEAPFPESLAEFFIRSFCPPGGTVLDCFSGSGTSAAVAIRNGRNAIAIDCRMNQCELTERRIHEAIERTRSKEGAA